MKYAIAAGHEKTAQAAESILLEGGNAVDAAIAAFLVTWVCEPCMASAGGGGFAQIYTAKRESVLLDFFCQTPRSKHIENREFFPIEVNF
ncbi:MAG: gamma-glutamyltransferase, partial [Bacteroidota bacterium]